MVYRRSLALLVLLAIPAVAQRGGLFGRILDPSEGAVAEAAVTVTSEDTGFRRVTSSDPAGNFAVASLDPGVYKITVRKDGFRTAVRFGVRLLPDTPVRADFVLPVGSVEETITVEDTEPLAGRTDPSTGGGLQRDEIERLPLNGGGILGMLELTGGTNVVPATRGEAGQFTSTGQRPNTNSFTVDGVSANTGVTAGGLPAQSTGGVLPAVSAFGSLDSLIALDAVEQFRVRTSTSVAEFGRMPGAAVSLTTRSGSNQFHGTTSYGIRNELANANDWFGNAAGYGPLPLRLQDASQTFGGPLRRNRTFFFLSYEHMALLQPFVWSQPVPSPAGRQTVGIWVQPVLNLFPAPTNPATSASIGEWTGRTDHPAHLDAGGVRIDQAIGSRVSLFGRYNDSPSDNAFGTLAVDQLSLRSQSLTLGLNARPWSGLVLDFRANESESRADSVWTGNGPGGTGCELDLLAADFETNPAPCSYLVRFDIGGIGQLVSGREGDRWQRQFQFVQSTGFQLGKHALEVGADYRNIVLVRRDPTATLGVIADTLSALTSTTNLWISKSSAQNASAGVQELSLWIQDTWQATSRLTVAGGLRWEFSPATQSQYGPLNGTLFFNSSTGTFYQALQPQPLWPTSYHDFAPRLGLAWRLTGDGRTVLRAGGGIYYDSSLSIAADILNGGPLGIGSYTSGRAGIFPAQLSYGFLPNLTVPEVQEWNLSLERALGTHDVLSVGYVGSVGKGLIRREVGGPGNTPTSLVAVTTNNGRSDYHALEVQYRRRVARGLQAIASYSWAHSIDNDSSDSFLVWVGSPASNWGSSDFDLRQSLSASATYELPATGRAWLRGWALDGIFRARSGFPITVLQSEEYMGISLINAFRPNLALGEPLWIPDAAAPGGRLLNPAAFLATPTGVQGILGRNALTGFGMWQVDLALRREFRLSERTRLQFRLEAFNALNHPNFADPVAYLDSPVFGQSTSMLNMMLGTGSPGSGLSPILQTGGPRSLQARIKWQF
jgi:hypothetical protein